MAKVTDLKFTKTDYENNMFWVGYHRDEDGNPLVVVDGKAIGTVEAMVEFLSRYEPVVQCQCSALSARLDMMEARLGVLEAGVTVTTRAAADLNRSIAEQIDKCAKRILAATRDANRRNLK